MILEWLALGIIVVAGCGAPAPPTPAAPSEPQQAQPAPVPAEPARPPGPADKLRVAYATLNGLMTPLWLAHDEGFFEKRGIDAELTFIASGSRAMQTMVAGEVDIGIIGADSAIAAALGGADSVYLGGLADVLIFDVYTIPSIHRPEDLRGKRLGISRFGTASDTATRFVLGKWGLAYGQDVTILEMGDIPTILAGMQGGALDAGILSHPTTSRARDAGFYRLADVTEMGLQYPQASLTTTRSFVASHEDLVQRFMYALVEGIHRFKTDRQASLVAMTKYLQLDDTGVLNEAYDIYTRLTQQIPFASEGGGRTILDIIAASNPKAREVKPGDFIDSRFTRKIEESGFAARLYGRN